MLVYGLLSQGDQVSDSEATVVLVVPQPCCGMLIGKGGSEFHVKKLGKLQNIGSLTEIIASGAKPNIKVSFMHPLPKTPMRSPVNKDAQEESVTIAVADEHMGAVIGRGGRIINEISKCPEILFLDQLVSLEVLRTS
ncbi:uncharacterized protein [Aegilops tauschii subsp. strangulata]